MTTGTFGGLEIEGSGSRPRGWRKGPRASQVGASARAPLDAGMFDGARLGSSPATASPLAPRGSPPPTSRFRRRPLPTSVPLVRFDGALEGASEPRTGVGPRRTGHVTCRGRRADSRRASHRPLPCGSGPGRSRARAPLLRVRRLKIPVSHRLPDEPPLFRRSWAPRASHRRRGERYRVGLRNSGGGQRDKGVRAAPDRVY